MRTEEEIRQTLEEYDKPPEAFLATLGEPDPELVERSRIFTTAFQCGLLYALGEIDTPDMQEIQVLDE